MRAMASQITGVSIVHSTVCLGFGGFGDGYEQKVFLMLYVTPEPELLNIFNCRPYGVQLICLLTIVYSTLCWRADQRKHQIALKKGQ